MKRTLIAIEVGILVSLMLAPHRGRGLLRFADYYHAPFPLAANDIDITQLVLQTIFVAVLFALIVDTPWRRPKKGLRD